ncbi:MAG: HyaD/HybD family hydrogenase maturation endopeptidase [Anaerolineae bacterium]
MTRDNELSSRTFETSGSGDFDAPPARRTVVLGLGNPIMGDDGLGLVALERLRALEFAPPVTLVDGGTWGLALLGDVEAADSLLLLDALEIGAAPGSLHIVAGDDIPRVFSTKLSPHQVDVRELLALATLRGTLPRRMILVGIQVAEVDLGLELSPAVASQVDAMVDAAVAVLASWGHYATERPVH